MSEQPRISIDDLGLDKNYDNMSREEKLRELDRMCLATRAFVKQTERDTHERQKRSEEPLKDWDAMTPDEQQEAVAFHERFLHLDHQEALREARFIHRIGLHTWEDARKLSSRDSPTTSEIADSRQRKLAGDRAAEEIRQRTLKRQESRPLLKMPDRGDRISQVYAEAHARLEAYKSQCNIHNLRCRNFITEHVQTLPGFKDLDPNTDTEPPTELVEEMSRLALVMQERFPDPPPPDFAPDEDGHVWLPYKQHYDWQVEVCWRCRCLKIHMGGGRIKYKYGMFQLMGKDQPPSPCRKHRKSNCPI